MIREPVVAGRFYPAQPEALARQLDGFLDSPTPEPALGVVVPHAGYSYSGAIAGMTFARVAIPQTVVLLGPNHHGLGAPAALWPAGSWRTPLGECAIDAELAQQLLAATPLLQADVVAHRHEHALEVQLPFLQRLNPRVRIVPISVGRLVLADLLALGAAIGRAQAPLAEPPLLVASSDMTHYEPADEARRKDHQALDRVCALDPQGLYRTVRDGRISMCGVLPTVVMLAAALEIGARSAAVVRYGHSGETTGETAEVVGYAGVIVK